VTAFLESSLSLIVLAIIVSVRLVLFLRKRAENRARNHPPPPLDGVEAIEAEGAGLALDDAEEEDFSAWALSVEQSVPVPAPAAPIRDAGPFLAVPPPEIPKAVPAPAPVFEAWTQPYAEAAVVPVAAKTSPARTDGVFWRKLMNLPPLTQGVILAEILGPPKGLL
jgi:hypothetical protein